mmetsp:Transcript_55194/g.123384  ORF Transcript_55194/g.123384 Transcript_55194/m.123384 type:complete len:201 (-) Transcript_55194:182-784(-)
MMKPSAAAPTAETGSAAAAEMGSAAAETGNAAALDPRPNFIVSQFHGDDIAMSWFIIVKQYNASATMKLIVWGTGTEVPPLLFNLIADPNEDHDLIQTATGAREHEALVADLTADLRGVVDFPRVALEVAQYGVDSLRQWVNATADWQTAIHLGLRWDAPWTADPNGSLAAIEALLAQPGPAKITPCRRNFTRPASAQWG